MRICRNKASQLKLKKMSYLQTSDAELANIKNHAFICNFKQLKNRESQSLQTEWTSLGKPLSGGNSRGDVHGFQISGGH